MKNFVAWVDVKTSLPADCESVLIYKQEGICNGYYDADLDKWFHDGWLPDDVPIPGIVTHWAELPEPPK